MKITKLVYRCEPHELTEQNRKDRVRMCLENLAKFEDGTWRLCDVVTGDESWFYWRQVGKKQSNKSWVAEGEKARTVVKIGRFESKNLFTIFFRTSGVVHISYLDKGKTIDHQTYIKDCLKPLVSTLKEQRPMYGTKNLKFHHDNARPHVHKDVKKYLESQNLTVMSHPPYSPDLAPCDFWLNSYIKQRLSNHSSSESLSDQITEIVSSIPESEYRKTFNKWIERMQYCVKYQGHYFEHLIK